MAVPDKTIGSREPTCPCVDTTWVALGTTRCTGDFVTELQGTNCGGKRWVTTTEPVSWVDTGDTNCINNILYAKQVNQCGHIQWRDTGITCNYCPSVRIADGFGYHTADPKHPDASVELTGCVGDTTMDSVWIFPNAGPGHTKKLVDCSGAVIGYLANTSTCADDCSCIEEIC